MRLTLKSVLLMTFAAGPLSLVGCVPSADSPADADGGNPAAPVGGADAGGLVTVAQGRVQGYAIDAQGAEHALSIANGVASYGFCGGGCTSPSGWTWVGLPGIANANAYTGSLALDSAGHPHVAWGVTIGAGVASTTEVLLSLIHI